MTANIPSPINNQYIENEWINVICIYVMKVGFATNFELFLIFFHMTSNIALTTNALEGEKISLPHLHVICN